MKFFLRAVLLAAIFGIGGLLSVAHAQEQVVKVATLPYMDYTVLVAAHELGLDKEVGLNFEFTEFPLEAPAAQALIRGDVDIGQGALAPLVPLLPQASDLRVVLTNDQFKGLIFIGREGAMDTFEEIQASGRTFEEARQQVLNQFKGKTIVMVKSSFESTVKGILEDVGLSISDVNILDFPDDAQAAIAFMRGTGDLYIGSLPQEMRLLAEPGYEAVAGNEALGPAGLFFANTLVTDNYLENHEETVLKVLAVHFRLARYLREQPNDALRAMLDHLNKSAGSAMSFEDGLRALKRFIVFQTLDDVTQGVYNSKSPNYWKIAMKGYIDQNAALGKIAIDSVDMDKIVVQEQMFTKLLNDAELMAWIKKPL